MNRDQINSTMQGWMDTQRKKEIVFIENGRAVTDSLTVAEVFGKEHARVMRDIRELQCSDNFRVGNFAESTYTNAQGRDMPRYLITEKGFTLLAMGYTGQKAMEFKERYIAEFERMRQQLQGGVNIGQLSPQLQLLINMEQGMKQLEARQQSTEQTITTIKETFLQRDDDWRKSINSMLNAAARRLNENYRDLRSLSYDTLELRGKCDLKRRLANLRDRLADSGATKTRINDTNRLDVIESDQRLKEIYTTIVKELSIGSIAN
ncbi:hypothetical protein J6TS7_34990 [Paenibacillus dendritiformis]|uniref:Rha family transcriptional regulator n=1 Tax=Paenibacillus TaxID=44249 RepID=UPI001B2368F8|nr:Rha family transcriptional regulator [Paenibacillus dendritiformis]MEB9893826.1 Rha family transcriptional regulator [Bacillus cereus]GIO79889.1 hypothetical protein J6TS7_34990 [Paenibacillus dendritiformis]